MSFPTAVTQVTRVRSCRKFEGHTKSVRGAIHLPGGQRMMTCSEDGSLRAWDLQSEQQMGIDWRDGESAVYAIALSPDGKKIVSGGSDGAVRLWDVDTGKVIAKWTGHTRDVNSLCWSQDGGTVVSGSDDGTARVWDVESGKTVLAIETEIPAVYAVIYSPGTTMIATGGYDWTERLKTWDAKTGTLVANLKGHTERVNCLVWTADGKTLISGSDDHSIRMWNTATWQQIANLTWHYHVVTGIAISPNGRILASASWDKTARLWNLENSQPIGSPLQHEDEVNSVSFSTDGHLLATSCHDKNAYTWDVSAVVKEAGFSHLLNLNEKSDPNATQRRGDWRRNPYPGPSNDTLHHPRPSGTSPSSAHQQYISPHLSSRGGAPPGRISPLQHIQHNADNTPIRPHILGWARHLLFHTRNGRHDEGIELHDHHTAVVDVPLAQGIPRYYNRRELQIKKEKEKEDARKAKIAKEEENRTAKEAKISKNTTNASAASSQPPPNNVTQQPEAQAQPTPEPHSGGITTLSTTPATSTITSHWTRFRSVCCCASAQSADGRH